MTIQDGVLRLKDKIRDHLPNMAIDIFLESLAMDKQKNAIAVILSGTGTDGTKGVEAIKRHGGVVIVQDPLTASFDGMPNSAIASGSADLILSPEMIAEELMDFLKEAPFLKAFNLANKRDAENINQILDLIHSTTSYDFNQYKRPTINRRLSKRMAEKNLKTTEDYLRVLQGDTAEVMALAKEFLIGVTKFFRDDEVFDELKSQVLPAIFLHKKAEDTIKIWCVACSTGEEAYSLAIIFHEYLARHQKTDVTIKIFATDIDREAVEIASRGIYHEDSVKHLSPERLSSFFIIEQRFPKNVGQVMQRVF